MNSQGKVLLFAVKRCGFIAVLAGVMIFGQTTSAMAATPMEQEQPRRQSQDDHGSVCCRSGPQRRGARVEGCKGLFIVPQLLRGAFIFGGAGGSGVLLARDEKTGQWSQPAFYNIGAVSFGIQAGGDASELVFVVTSQRALEKFYSSDFKLGADAGITVGPVGGSTSVAGVGADIVSYGRTKGAFGGMALDGAIIAVSDESNERYYGRGVRAGHSHKTISHQSKIS